MPPRTGFGLPREVYVPCPRCGTSPSELLKQMRSLRVLRCTVCGTLWREPLPPRQADAQRAQETPDATSDPKAREAVLIPVADRRKTAERRRSGLGGRRDDDVKRPQVDPRKWRGSGRSKKKPG